MVFEKDVEPHVCARQCCKVLEQVHKMRLQGVKHSGLRKTMARLQFLFQTKFLDWSLHVTTKSGERALTDFMVVTFAHLYCMCNPEMWQRPRASETDTRLVQRKLRQIIRKWQLVTPEEHKQLSSDFMEIMPDACHALVTYLSSFIQKEGESLDDNDMGLSTSRYADIDREADLGNSVTQAARDAHAESLEKQEQEAKVGEEKDILDAVALCPFRFAELFARTWFVCFHETSLVLMHAVQGPWPLEKLQQTGFSSITKCVEFSTTELSNDLARWMLCLRYSPMGAQFTAMRSCVLTGRQPPKPMSILRQEIGTAGASKVVELSQVLPRNVFNEYTPGAPLEPLQETWVLIGVNRIWASYMRDALGTDFVDNYLVMPFDTIQKRDDLLCSKRWGGHWRRPLLVNLQAHWCVQYPNDHLSEKRFTLIQCRSLLEALHVWTCVMEYAPFHSTAIDGRPCHQALQAIRHGT